MSYLKIFSTTAVVVAMSAAPFFANANSAKDVVKDARGNIVKSQVSGDCVRTSWDSAGDECAGTPAPSAPAAAPQSQKQIQEGELSRSYLVFFDLNSAKLSQDTKNIVSKSVDDAKSMGGGTYHVVGHTDTTGSTAYNLRLSKKRAAAVKADLVKLGIDENKISTDAKGESELLVPTADGVLEPQNRRVEIKFTK